MSLHPLLKQQFEDARRKAGQLDLRKLLRALQSVRDGDFSVRLPSDQTGISGKVADTFNEIVASSQRMAREIERAGQMVGKDGKTRHRVTIDRRSGSWGAMESSLNTLIEEMGRSTYADYLKTLITEEAKYYSVPNP